MVYLFANCRFDLESRELARDGEVVHLSPKAFELLRTLVQARPRVVSKDELMGQLWPSTFVAEGNLPVLVGEVRSAIGDSAREPKLIKTHFSVGYSFVGAARELRPRPQHGAEGPAVTLRVGARRVVLGLGTNDVGRAPESDVWLNDGSVSRQHARIVVAPDAVTLEDLESKNGTTVDGRRLEGVHRLVDGEQIVFGTVACVYLEERHSESTTVTLRQP